MDLNDVPASGNRWLLSDILRKECGFNGFVVSDALAVGNPVTHGFANDPLDAAFMAMRAGLNIEMASLTYSKNLPQLVAEHKVSEAELENQRFGSASRPVRKVKGFRRVTLQPGETKTLQFPLGKD